MPPGALYLSRHNLADLVQVEDHVLGTRDADTPDARLRPIALFDAKKSAVRACQHWPKAQYHAAVCLCDTLTEYSGDRVRERYPVEATPAVLAIDYSPMISTASGHSHGI